jgi:hypothetical protein
MISYDVLALMDINKKRTRWATISNIRRPIILTDLKMKQMKTQTHLKKGTKTPLFFVVTIIFSLFFACGNNSSSNNMPVAKTTITVDANKKEQILYSEIFDSARYIRLQTTDDILIKHIYAIRYANNCVYILDAHTQTLFSFDAHTGKCLWKIRSVGQGPQEYLRAEDFYIDEKNNRLYLWSRMDKVIEYDLSGNFVKEYNIRLQGYSFASDDEYLYVYVGNTVNPDNILREPYYLNIYNRKDGSLKKELPFENNVNLGTTRTVMSPNAFYHYNNVLYLFSLYFYEIYALKGDKVEITYRFDFRKLNFPKNLATYSDEELRQVNYAWGLHLCWENNRYLATSTFMNQEFYDILYAKQEDQVYVGTFINDLDHLPLTFMFVQATNDFVLGHLRAEDCFLESKNEPSFLMKKLRSELKEDDNPVLFFYYFKKSHE